MSLKLIFSLAWRNLWRTPKRTSITLTINALGVMAVLVFAGFALFTFDSLEESSARSTGHIIFGQPDSFTETEDVPLERGLVPTRELMQGLNGYDSVRYVLPKVEFSGLISNGQKSLVFVGSGVTPKEFRVRGPFLSLKEGELLSVNPKVDDIPQALLGVELARQLKAKPGDELTLLGTTVDGVLNAQDIQVKGIVSLGVPEIDKRLVMVHLDTAQALIDTDKVSNLSIFLYNLEDTLSVQQQINQDFPQYETRNWEDLAFFYHKVRDLYHVIFGVVGVVILVIVFFAIHNTLAMVTLERTKEIGTLAALGTRDNETLSLFLAESFYMGLIGALLGTLLAGFISLFLYFAEFQMPPPPGSTEGYPLFINFDSQVALVVSIAVILSALFAALISTRKAVKKPIVEALRDV